MIQKRHSRFGRGPFMLSIPHLIIVFVVALVVFGPEKLPELARNIGKIMGEFKRATGDLRSTFEGHLRDLEREADQRRTPTPAPSPQTSPETSPSPVAATAPEPPPAPPTPGTVSTTPSHLLGIGTPVEELPVPDAPQNGAPPEALPSEAVQQSPLLDLGHHPETLTDAGTRPA
jgi:TatA/E family protein of Tat protein translocase